MVIVLLPNFSKSTQALKDLPTNLEISCALPFCNFFLEILSLQDLGIIEYSAVTQPCSFFSASIKGGTFSSTVATHKTFVSPKENIHEPSACFK